jgi:hypothetical protein
MGASAGQRVDLDQPAVKARVYEACLIRGGPFDVYRWVNLTELARVWRTLRLPVDVAAAWTRALRDAGFDVDAMSMLGCPVRARRR